jgi:hypothetical protein
LSLRLEIGRGFVKALVITVIVTAAVVALYAICGHRLIEKAYLGQLPGSLDRLVKSRDLYPLEHFTALTDRVIYRQVIFFPVLNLIFYYALYRVLACLVRRARGVSVRSSPGYRFRYDWAVALLVYVVCTCAFFAADLASIGTDLIGPPEDNQKHFWNMWYVNQAIASGHSLSHTDLIFYPEGTDDLFHDYSWYNLALSLPLVPLLGLAASYNILILHTFVLAGLAAFLLIRYLVRDSLAAIVGGFIFAFSPSHFAHALHHINVASIQFIPLFALFIIKGVRGGSWRDWLWAGCFLALSACGHPVYLVLCGFFVVACYAYLAAMRRRIVLRDVLAKSAALFGLTVFALSPLIAGGVGKVIRHPAVAGGGHGDFVADSAGLVTPHAWHLLGQTPLVRAANLSYKGNLWESTAYLGLVAIALLVVFRKRLVAGWPAYFAGLLAFAVLSLGTYVHVLGHRIQIVLPFSVIKHLPLLSQVRTPGRDMVFAYLFLAILVAAAVRLIGERPRTWRARVALVAAVGVLLALDYYSLSRDRTALSAPPCYRVIREVAGAAGAAGGRFGVLDVPGKYEDCERYMAYQTTHGLPIVQGAVPRKFSQTLVDRLAWGDLEAQHRQLAESSVKYVVIHKYLLSERDAVPVDALRGQYRTVYEGADCLVLEVF